LSEPNADTPYSMALLDLRADPLVLQIPAIKDRYSVFQFVDLLAPTRTFSVRAQPGRKPALTS